MVILTDCVIDDTNEVRRVANKRLGASEDTLVVVLVVIGAYGDLRMSEDGAECTNTPFVSELGTPLYGLRANTAWNE